MATEKKVFKVEESTTQNKIKKLFSSAWDSEQKLFLQKRESNHFEKQRLHGLALRQMTRTTAMHSFSIPCPYDFDV